MAKKQYVVAGIKDYCSEEKKQGAILDTFREIAHAKHETQRASLRKSANEQGIGNIGIFLDGKFLEEL